jgi:phage host-nuclease inhibitor protein Gam
VPKRPEGLKDWSEVDNALARLCVLDAAKKTAEARLNESMATLKLSHRLQMEDIAKEDGALRSGIERFAEAHSTEFKGPKTIERLHGILAFRTTPPAVKKLNKTWTDNAILEGVRALGRKFLRIQEEINKEEILSAYAAKKLTAEQLADAGLRIGQHEQFSIDLKQEVSPSLNP